MAAKFVYLNNETVINMNAIVTIGPEWWGNRTDPVCSHADAEWHAIVRYKSADNNEAILFLTKKRVTYNEANRLVYDVARKAGLIE